MELAAVDDIAGQLEQLADVTDGVERWCSGPDWTISTHRAFGASAGGGTPLVLGDVSRWAAVLARYPGPDGETILAGLEPLWGFSCPLLLPDPAAQAPILAASLGAVTDWDRLVLTGFTPESAHLQHTSRALSVLGPVIAADGISRCTASLAEGTEAWLGRRSRRFRARLRQTAERAAVAGIEVHDVVPGGSADLLDRLVAIEERSWKGREGDGILPGPMRVLYGSLIQRLSARGRLRALVATQQGQDVGFILGGVRSGIYRGLQLTHSQDVADLGVGHLLQHSQIAALGGSVHTYDLGMDMPYKRRWADEVPESTILIVRRDR